MNTYELEALKPDALRQVLNDAICSVLDIDAYTAEVEKEEEAAFSDVQRQRMLVAVGAYEVSCRRVKFLMAK